MNADAILFDQRIYDSDDINFKGDYINLDYENHIVGGIEVDDGEFDFMVSWGRLCGKLTFLLFFLYYFYF